MKRGLEEVYDGREHLLPRELRFAKIGGNVSPNGVHRLNERHHAFELHVLAMGAKLR